MRIASHTIGARIFGAFIAMSAIIAVMGLAGYAVLSAAGDIAVNTFDGPLMAINYARAAQTDFANMKLAELRYEHAPAAKRASIAAEIADIASHLLRRPGRGGAAQPCRKTNRRWSARSGRWWRMARRARARRYQRAGTAGRQDRREVRSAGGIPHRPQLHRPPPDGEQYRQLQIRQHRHDRVGAAAGRRHHLAAAQPYRAPLARRRRVADRIAKGEMQTPIPEGGDDETGALLNSMTVMQTNIRERIQRETELRRSAENRLVEALGDQPRRRDADGRRRHDRHVQQRVARLLPPDRLPADAGPGLRRGAGGDPEPACAHPGGQRTTSTPRAMPNWNWPMAAGCA